MKQVNPKGQSFWYERTKEMKHLFGIHLAYKRELWAKTKGNFVEEEWVWCIVWAGNWMKSEAEMNCVSAISRSWCLCEDMAIKEDC